MSERLTPVQATPLEAVLSYCADHCPYRDVCKQESPAGKFFKCPLWTVKDSRHPNGSSRHRWGEMNHVEAAVDADTVIEIGDLVWQDVDNAKPASMFAPEPAPTAPPVPEDVWQRLLPALFAEKFLGVAMQRSRKGETDSIRVATTGVFEFDCPSGTFELGDLVGVYYWIGGNQCLAQWVAPVACAKLAIGRVAKRVPTAATSVLVDVRSRLMTNGVL